MVRVVALIPARGGSKGIPRKNLTMVWAEPMIAHSIRIAKMCPLIHEVWVSTDDDEIANVSRERGAKVIMRPSELAGDTSSDLETFQHFVDTTPIAMNDEDIIVHLRPTCPKRDCDFLTDCIEKFSKSNCTSLRTVVPQEKSPYKMYRIESGELVPLFDHVTILGEEGLKIIREPFNQCRQVLPSTFLHNGCIDIIRVSTIRGGSMTGNRIMPIVMDEIVDIDTVADLKKITRV